MLFHVSERAKKNSERRQGRRRGCITRIIQYVPANVEMERKLSRLLREYEEVVCPNILNVLEKFKAKNHRYRDAKVLNGEEFKRLLVDLALPENLTSGYWMKTFTEGKERLFFTHEQALGATGK